MNCGGGGIRTPGAHKGTTVFETAPFDRSGTPPSVRIADFALVRFVTSVAGGLTGGLNPASSAADQQGRRDGCSGARDGLRDLRQGDHHAEIQVAPHDYYQVLIATHPREIVDTGSGYDAALLPESCRSLSTSRTGGRPKSRLYSD